MTRKVFYSVDVLLCCILLVFSYHNANYFLLPQMGAVIPGMFFAIYPVWLRMNVSFLLYRKERMAVIPTVLCCAILEYVFCSFNGNDLGWRYCLKWLDGVLGNGETLGWEYIAATVLNLWTLSVPPVAYIVLWIRKSLTSNDVKWHHLLGTYMFRDNAGRMFLPMFAIVLVAYLLGKNTIAELSDWGVVTLPTLAYALVSKHVKHKPSLWEYAMMVVSLYVFDVSQYFHDAPRVGLLVASAAGILIVCIRLAMSTRRITISIAVYLLVAFMLPLLTLGYNVYVGTDYSRGKNYQDDVVTRGVMNVHHGTDTGVRSRYRILMDYR